MHSCRQKFCCNLFEVIPYIYWTIGHVGARVGHVDFTFFVSISFALDANANAISGGIWALGVD